jgi:hypothetical protein
MNAILLSDSPSPIEISVSQTHPSYDHSSSSLYFSTHSEASPTPDDVSYDFITILESCQNLDIDFLPITWQPALDALGVGGQAEVRQSLVNISTSFAFGRVKLGVKPGESFQEAEVAAYRALRSQISVLAHPEIRSHPNVISLIGVCWDIRPQEEGRLNQSVGGDYEPRRSPVAQQWKVWPVLVYEKTKHGDLACFMRSQYGRDLDVMRKLKLCMDIARGIRDMHRNRKDLLHLGRFCWTANWF